MIDYDPHDWDSHLFDVKGSMVREIMGRVLTCVAWSVLVVLLYQLSFMRWIAIPSTVHSLVGVALGLLLVFRTNAAYDRFWEGRKLWGSITNESRNLGRMASVLLASDPQRLLTLLRWAQVFPYAARARLHESSDLGPAARHLPADEIDAVLRAPVPAAAVARQITRTLAAARDAGVINPYDFVALDQNVQLLIDYYGGCERIENTPLPFPYMVHLRRALILYCFTLPLALVKDYSWGTILDVLVVAYIFFGIEEIGVEIGDPFGFDDNDLPIESYCVALERYFESLIPPGVIPAVQPATPESPAAPALDPIPIE
jgi:putative membrane protein